MSTEPTPRDGDVAQEGPIWEGVVPGVLRGLYVGRRTGVLTFSRDDERRGVRFRHGSIVNADTSVREDRLGAVLVRAGRLSEAGRKRAEGFAVRDHRRFGSVLVDLGLLDREGLEEALALHVDAVLSKVFGWTEGRYEFRRYGELPLAEGDVTLRVSTGDLILQAARSVQDPDVVRYNLGNLGRVLVASSDPLLRFQRIRLTPLDGYVMSRVDGVLSAREVIQLIPLPAGEVEHSLFALLSTGVVEFRTADSPPGPRPAAAREPPPPSVATPEPTVILDRPSFEELPAPDPTVILDRPSLAVRPPLDPTVVLDRARLEEPAPVDPTVVVGGPFERAAGGRGAATGDPRAPPAAEDEEPLRAARRFSRRHRSPGPRGLLPAREALPSGRAARRGPRRDARCPGGDLPPPGRVVRSPPQPAHPGGVRAEPRAGTGGGARRGQ